MVEEINRQTQGWKEYFKFGYPREAFRKMNHYIYERLKQHAERRSQRGYKPGSGESYYAFLKRIGWQPL